MSAGRARSPPWWMVIASPLALLSALAATATQHGQQSTVPPALVEADRVAVGRVETEMRHVLYHAAGGVLDIRSLRGRLSPVKPGVPPWFEDRNSFTIAVDTAEVWID